MVRVMVQAKVRVDVIVETVLLLATSDEPG